METEQIDRLQNKLQAFYDQLNDDEKQVVARVLLRAAGEADVTGHAACTCGCAAPPAPGFSIPDGAELSLSTGADVNLVVPL